MVDGLETAIRNALARSDSSDPAARARIYDSARTAVDKSLQKQASTPDAAAAQRRRVEEVIAAIEAEHAAPVIAPQGMAPDLTASRAPLLGGSETFHVDAPAAGRLRERSEMPSIGGLQARAEDRLGRAAAPEQPAPVRPSADASPGARQGPSLFRRKAKPAKAEKRRRRGGGIGSLFTQLLLLFIVIGVALWWISANGGVEQIGREIAESGVGLLGEEGSGGPIAPAQRVGAGQFAGNWVTVFAAGSPDAVEAGGAVTVEAVDEGEEPALRIASVSGGDQGEVRIPLDGEALASAGGGPVLFALTMRAAGDEPTQIYLRCDFAGQDNCNRRRFDVNYEVTDIVFEADLSSVEGEAALILNSDVSGEGKSIDLFSIRVQPAAAE